MKNITELREELGKVFEGLRDGGVEPKVASEMNNTAGKMINSLKVELEYNMMIKGAGKQSKIIFLES